MNLHARVLLRSPSLSLKRSVLQFCNPKNVAVTSARSRSRRVRNMEAIPGLLYSKAFISRDDIETGARALIRTIRPQWSPDDVTVKVFTDGTSNQLVGCCNQQRPQAGMVLVRVYGPKTELLIDRDAELVIMTLLSAAACGPGLLAKFSNGVAYEFVPGHCLTLEQIRTEKYGSLTAKAMAKIHSIDPSNLLPPSLTIDREPKLFQNLKKYLDLLPEKFDDETKHRRFQQLKGKCDFAKEVEVLERELLPLESPVVLCHNDLQINNIIYSSDKDEICFIDFEYSAFNFAAYDIAVHFCEYCGIDNPDFSLYPDKDTQLKWLAVYLKAKTISAVEEEDVHRLFVVVNKFALAAHLHWATWALIQAKNSVIDYDFIGYSEAKLGEYFKRRTEFLNLS